MLRIHIGLRIRDCILMFEVHVFFFQILYLLTECLTHCLVVSFTYIYIGQDPQLPHEDSSHCPTVSTDYFDMRSLLGGGSVYCHLGHHVLFILSCVVLLYHMSYRNSIDNR